MNFLLDTTAPTLTTFTATSNSYQTASLTWGGLSDSTSGLKNVKVYRSLTNSNTSGSLLTTATSDSNGYVDTSITNGVTYYYYIVVYDNTDHSTTSVVRSVTDTSSVNATSTVNVSAAVASFNTGTVRNYIYSISGLDGVSDVTVLVQNASGFGVSVEDVDASYVGFQINPDNTSFSGDATVIFYISSARFNATNANTTRIFVRKYDDEGTYEELLNTSYMGFEASKGYKFNFTTTGFSIFIPAYIAAAEEEDEGGNEEGGNNGGSSGGGSFGYWTATYIVNSSLLESENGYTRLLTVKQRLKLNISGQSHYVGVVKLEANSAVINVSSRMQQATLQVGESRMFDITEDGASDIEVTLKSVANGSAEIGISLVK